MFDVVTCGFRPAPLAVLPEHENVRVLPSPDADGFIDTALAVLGDAERGRRILLLHHDRPGLTHACLVLRGLLRSSDAVPVPLRRPMTGLAATATWLAAMSARSVSGGAALAAIPGLAARLPTYAASATVARLDLPQVGLRHHLISWAPGVTFAIALDGEPRVEVGHTSAEPTDREAPLDVVRAGDERLAARVASTLPAGRVEQTVDLETPDGGAVLWGKARFYEHTLVPHVIDDFVQSLSTEQHRRCPQCGDVLDTYCQFCFAQEGVFA